MLEERIAVLAQAEGAAQDAGARLTALSEELTAAQEAKAALEARVEALAADGAAAATDAEARVSALTEEVATLRDARAATDARHASSLVRGRCDRGRSRASAMDAELAALREANATLNARVLELSSASAGASGSEESATRLSEELAALQKTNAELEQLATKNKDKFSAAVKKGKGFQSQVKTLEAELQALRAESGTAGEAVAQVKAMGAANAELRQQCEALEAALEDARGEATGHADEVAAKLEAAEHANAELRAQADASAAAAADANTASPSWPSSSRHCRRRRSRWARQRPALSRSSRKPRRSSKRRAR